MPEAIRQTVTRSHQIADAYRAATLKGAWYGPSLADLLARTSPELAATPPASGAHSISTLLQHILLWNDRVLNISEGTPMPRWEPDKEWAEPPIPWNELVARWNCSRNQLEEKIRNFPVGDIAKQVPGRNYPYETLLAGIVEHAIYHSGQIAMILGMFQRKAR